CTGPDKRGPYPGRRSFGAARVVVPGRRRRSVGAARVITPWRRRQPRPTRVIAPWRRRRSVGAARVIAAGRRRQPRPTWVIAAGRRRRLVTFGWRRRRLVTFRWGRRWRGRSIGHVARATNHHGAAGDAVVRVKRAADAGSGITPPACAFGVSRSQGWTRGIGGIGRAPVRHGGGRRRIVIAYRGEAPLVGQALGVARTR